MWLSAAAFPVTQAHHSRCSPRVGGVHPAFELESPLLLVHQWQEFYPRLISCGLLSETTAKELRGRGWPHRVGLTSAGLWCLLSPPLECTNCGSGWVVLLCCLKVSTEFPGSEVFPAIACHLPGAIWHEIQSNLQMVASCVGAGDAWERLGCVLRLAATSAGPGTTQQELQGTPRPDAACWGLVNLWEILGISGA